MFHFSLRVFTSVFVMTCFLGACGNTPGGEQVDAQVDAGPDAIVEFACTLEEIQPVIQCAWDSCLSNLDSDAGTPDATEIATCLATQCFQELLLLSPECLGCVTSGLSADPAVIVEMCTSLALP